MRSWFWCCNHLPAFSLSLTFVHEVLVFVLQSYIPSWFCCCKLLAGFGLSLGFTNAVLVLILHEMSYWPYSYSFMCGLRCDHEQLALAKPLAVLEIV